jgi:hypothetical protein
METKWIIDQLVPKGGITMIVGESMVGKSWIAMEMACSVAGGNSFLGTFPVNPSRVHVYDAETSEAEWYGRIGQVEPRHPSSIERLSVTFGVPDLTTDRTIEAEAKSLNDNDVKLVVGDPLVPWLPIDIDQSVSADIALFFDRVRKLQEATGASFLFVIHAHKPIQPGAWWPGIAPIRTLMDSVLIVRKTDCGLIEVEQEKNRWASLQAKFLVEVSDWGESINLRKIEDGMVKEDRTPKGVSE